ncbi:MAG TPA: hypothetical protein VIR01_13655, partial [Pyrinomonadaceae bacterium]
MSFQRINPRHRGASLILAFLLVISPIFSSFSRAEALNDPPVSARSVDETNPAVALAQIMRLERIEVEGGAELVTVFARLDGLESTNNDKWIPLVSILRDTLGDNTVENNRLRYVWPLTYTRPSMKQRIAAAIPFFYARVGNKNRTTSTPPPALDLASPESEVWNKIFWTALQNILLDPYGTPIKASTSSYRRNT